MATKKARKIQKQKPGKATRNKRGTAKHLTKVQAMAKCPIPQKPPLPDALLVPPELTASDSRGEIRTLVRYPLEIVQVITSLAGTRRAGHCHLTGWHFCHLLSGQIHYYERPVGSSEEPKLTVIEPGQTFFTGPQTEHSMFFPVDSTFLNMANSERTKEDYEKDLVRLPHHLDDPILHPEASA